MVHNVAGGKHAGDAGGRGVALKSAFHPDIAAFHLELTGEKFGVGAMADGDKDPGEFNIVRAAIDGAFQSCTGHAGLIAEDFIQGGVPANRDIAVFGALFDLILQDLLTAELIAPMYYGDMARDIGEIQGFFERVLPPPITATSWPR